MLKFCKTRDVKSPTRANPGDAGFDMFVPDGVGPVDLGHGESALIPSGIKMDFPFGHCVIFFNKSGVASKKRLDVLACVVDHGYAGEVHLSVINNGLASVRIESGAKLLQGIMLPVKLCVLTETNEEEMWCEVIGSRGEGGFGSTGV